MPLTELVLRNIPFRFVCDIKPERDLNGRIREYMPQARYKGAGVSRLNSHGVGPFCRFTVPRNLRFAGVYAVTVSLQTKYIGECANLASRWGLGQYGSIQPKNCYVGGQSTNCKINNYIFKSCHDGQSVQLWFYQTENYIILERLLRVELRPD